MAEAYAYCRRLATSHYENFPVVSWLLPRALRPHMYAVYAYCRGVDDLGDEAAGDRLALLDEWEAELLRCYDGRRSRPALRRAAGHGPPLRHPARAVPAPDRGEPPRPARQPLPDLRRPARLLRVLREPRRAPGALPLRLPRRGATAALRRHLHRAPAHELLAGRRAATWRRAASTSRWRTWSASAYSEADLLARRVDARVPRADARSRCSARGSYFRRGLPLIDRVRGRLRAGPAAVHARRPGRPRRDRAAAATTCCRRRPTALEGAEGVAGAARAPAAAGAREGAP